MVLKGKAGDELLDTYEQERQPVDQANVDTAVASAMNHFSIDQALDLSPEKTAEENWAELEPIFDDNHPEAAEKRHALKDRKSTRLNSSHVAISYAVFCLKKKKQTTK